LPIGIFAKLVILNKEVTGLLVMPQFLIGFGQLGRESQELTNYLMLFANTSFIDQINNSI